MCWKGPNCLPPHSIKKFEDEEAGEDVELDLTPGTLEKTNDPVRMYLREMGTVPLLTREGEVEIAKRIERGQIRVLKALSRSPIVIHELLGLGEDLKKRRSLHQRSGHLRRRRDHRRDPAEPPERIHRKNRRMAKHTRKPHSCEEKFEAVSAEEEAQGPPPRTAGRWLARVVQVSQRAPQTRLHQQRAQAPDRPRQQNRRRHAPARPPGSTTWKSKADATRSEDQKKEYRRQSRSHPRRTGKNRAGSRSVASRNSSARSAKSSRATWTPSRPSAN